MAQVKELLTNRSVVRKFLRKEPIPIRPVLDKDSPSLIRKFLCKDPPPLTTEEERLREIYQRFSKIQRSFRQIELTHMEIQRKLAQIRAHHNRYCLYEEGQTFKRLLLGLRPRDIALNRHAQKRNMSTQAGDHRTGHINTGPGEGVLFLDSTCSFSTLKACPKSLPRRVSSQAQFHLWPPFFQC